MAEETKKFVFDFNKLSYDEFTELLGETDEDGNPVDMSDEDAKVFISKVLVGWPSDLEISPENVGKLGLLDFKELQKQFGDEMNRLFADSKN